MYMTAQVPRIEIGTASAGMNVAEAERRNRKITMITSTTAIISVSSTSTTASRTETERSIMVLTSTEAGICARSDGRRSRTASTTATVLASGCFWIASTMARWPFSQVATLSFSTAS